MAQPFCHDEKWTLNGRNQKNNNGNFAVEAPLVTSQACLLFNKKRVACLHVRGFAFAKIMSAISSRACELRTKISPREPRILTL